MSKRSLGTLTVDLILKMGGFQEGMDKSARLTKQRMKEISKSVDEAAGRFKDFALVGAGVIATASAIGIAMVNSARQTIDANSKLARSLDTSYDSLTALQLRAGDSGIDNLEGSLNRLNRRLGAVELASGPAAKSVERLQLDLEAMANMDVDQKIGYIGDRINELGISNEEAARHLQQLGFEQAAAIELFRNGSADVARYRREVDELGLSLDDMDALAIEQMNDALGIFGDMQQSAANKLTVALAPSVKALAETIERAWIETENFGLASVDFQDKFAEAVASALRGAATLLDVVDSRGEAFSYGLIGYLLFGMKGAAIGAVIGAVFSEVELQLRKLGFFGTHEDAAELARIESSIERLTRLRDDTLSQATAGMMDPAGYRADLQAQIDELQASAEQLRSTMSPEAFADFAEYFQRGEDATEGMAYWLREAAKAIERGPSDSSGITPRTAGAGDGGINPDEQEKLLTLFQSQEAALLRQIALFGETSQAASILYDTEWGSLSALNEEQKDRLLLFAEEIDYLQRMKEEREKMAEEAKRRQQVTEEFANQAARNMQNILADYLFKPFDEGVKGMLRSFGNMLLQMSSQVASAQLLKTLFGGLAGSANPFLSALGTSFAGLRDGGGYVPPGAWAIAGEIGPEIVTGPAMITSRSASSQMLAGGGGINITIDARDEGAEARIRSMIQQEMVPQIIAAARGSTVAALKRPRFA